MAPSDIFDSPSTKRLVAIVLSSFLATFIIARFFVYLVIGHFAPNLFLVIKGVRIHHFTYGFFILAAAGLFSILKHPSPNSKIFRWTAWFYGIGLGLSFDEFGMWIRLEDDYWTRQSYDAVIILILLLLNIAYLKELVSWLKEILNEIAVWRKR
ncbi:MAG: hypothetical protein HY982_00470 [Candidatus Magasanikbacteria bacterium]|nr:hypothetical protein [Candidatus Magasanikbacteria bacterium]